VKRILLLLLVVLAPSVLYASDLTTSRPHWSFEIKGGRLIPDIDNWSNVYDDRATTEFEGAAAYKITRQIEVGIEGGYSRTGGSGYAPLHNMKAGHVIVNFYPVDVYLLARGIFTEDQWVVPYVGGGWTRVYYREEIEDQSVARGYANGYHARGGLQFLLDLIDPGAANSFYRDFGVRHTYFFIEGKYTHAMADTTSSTSVDIGGKSLLGGFLFEF
jgi:hypothetical protein